jgi:hypothetical protein
MPKTEQAPEPIPDFFWIFPTVPVRPQDQLFHFWQALQRGKEALYHRAYAELCEAVTGKQPSDPPPDEETFAKQVEEFLEANRDKAKEAICVQFGYCEKMKSFGYFAIPIPLLLMLTMALFDALGAFGLASTTWAVTKGMLDKFCECS